MTAQNQTEKELEFFNEHGYRCDREQSLRNVGHGRENSLAMEAANQLRHLKSILRKMHARAKEQQLDWPELDEVENAGLIE